MLLVESMRMVKVMVLDDIADAIAEARKSKTAKEVARLFDKERKWVNFVQNGCNVRLDYNLVAGLHALGYELKLVKKKGGAE